MAGPLGLEGWPAWYSRRPRPCIPTLDQHFLNPFEKCLQYGRFPWTFATHVFLVLLVTCQAMLFFERDVRHVSRTTQHFERSFLGNGLGKNDIHTPQQLQGAVELAVASHFLINSVSVVEYHLADPEALEVETSWRDDAVHTTRLELSAFLGNGSSARDYLIVALPCLYDTGQLQMLAMLSLEFRLLEVGPTRGDYVYHWTVQTRFDGREAGVFISSVDATAVDGRGQEWNQLHSLDILLLVTAGVSLALTVRKIQRSLRTVSILRARPQTWAQLEVTDLVALFSPWWAFAMLAHAAQALCSITSLQPAPEVERRFQVIGVSCFLTWLNIIQYFESFPAFYSTFHTMAIASKGIFRFLISVSPLFFGYVLLGVCLFWQSSFFSTPTRAMASLFSLMIGDTVLDSFQEVYSITGFFGHMYLYTYLFTFIFVILNVHVGIVMGSYEETKTHPQRERPRQMQRLIAAGAAEAARSAGGSPTHTPPRSPRQAALPTPRARGITHGRHGQRSSSNSTSSLNGVAVAGGQSSAVASAESGVGVPGAAQAAVAAAAAAAALATPESPAHRSPLKCSYMRPGFYSSQRLLEALPGAFPDREPASQATMLLASLPLLEEDGVDLCSASLGVGVGVATSSGTCCSPVGQAQIQPGPPLFSASEVGSSRQVWEEFDKRLEALHIEVASLSMLQTDLPCGEAQGIVLAAALEDLLQVSHRAVGRAAAARAEAEISIDTHPGYRMASEA